MLFISLWQKRTDYLALDEALRFSSYFVMILMHILALQDRETSLVDEFRNKHVGQSNTGYGNTTL